MSRLLMRVLVFFITFSIEIVLPDSDRRLISWNNTVIRSCKRFSSRIDSFLPRLHINNRIIV